MNHQNGVSVQKLNKYYGRNQVLVDIDVLFAPGRVHALLGANGAGKSTLLSCLSGAEHFDSGEIRIAQTSHTLGFTPRQAFDLGISIIYQTFQLIGPMSVSDNIFLGQEIRTVRGFVDKKRQEKTSATILADLGIDLNPRKVVDGLSVGQQQMVEIARSVYRSPRVLILDEPTAALGAHEIEALHNLVRRLAHKEGLAVVYVSHLLGEVLEIADDVTVLRDGRVSWTAPRKGLAMDDLVEAISPSTGLHRTPSRKFDRQKLQPLLVCKDFKSTYTGPLDLTLHSGEIVGIYGVLGSGRTDFLEGLAGVRQSSGTVTLSGVHVSGRSPRTARKSGIALVASDRKGQSLFGELSAQENLLMPHYGRVSKTLRRPAVEGQIFDRVAKKINIIPPQAKAPADSFSGGNLQKIVVSRWSLIGEGIPCLLIDEPTPGVDVGARRDLHESIRAFVAENRAAVIFASSDPEEVLSLADTVMVLVGGRVVHIGSSKNLNEIQLAKIAQPSWRNELA